MSTFPNYVLNGTYFVVDFVPPTTIVGPNPNGHNTINGNYLSDTIYGESSGTLS
jgi:hypothetical protein